PPLAEQRRIVERVNELMPLVEEYGELEDAREELDAALPGRLRKSVLQLAVQGGLVPQDPADEPAGVLLERIRGQRRQLVAEGEMKAPKGGESIIFAGSDGRRYEKRVDARGRESEPVCIEDEIPFEIPESWEWARLESVTTYIQRGKSPKYSTVEKYPVIAQKCNQWSGFSVEKARFIDPATVSKYADERILKDGDLLWNSTGLGTLGRMAVYDSAKNRYGWAVADSHVTVIRTREDWLDHRFAFAYFAGPSVQSEIEDQASGSTKQKELAQETVRNYLIPVPPLAEQRRIVYEVDWLFKILV
ncbi:restriction endonuclease subunit S, partial [Alistipes putredinis]